MAELQGVHLSPYYCFLPVRDGEKTIGDTLTSLLGQTHRPHKIVVINDGSADRTGEVIDGFVRQHPDIVITTNTHSMTRDYSRIVKLWNLSMSIADMTTHDICKEHEGESCSVHCAYHMISGGDCRYAPDYAEKLVSFMDSNKNHVVCSGDYGQRKSVAPHGAGRFVRQDYFYENYREYPEIVGYESEILYQARFKGYKTTVLNDARFKHLDQLGHSHNFVEFGYAMRALGYYFPYVLLKVALEFFGPIGPAGSLNLLKSYLCYKATGGYYSLFPDEFRRRMKQHQKRLLRDLITG